MGYVGRSYGSRTHGGAELSTSGLSIALVEQNEALLALYGLLVHGSDVLVVEEKPLTRLLLLGIPASGGRAVGITSVERCDTELSAATRHANEQRVPHPPNCGGLGRRCALLCIICTLRASCTRI